MPSGKGDYAVIVDTATKLPGRGAWLHPAPRCVHEAIRRRAFTKALRIDRPPDTSALLDHAEMLDSLGNRIGSKEHEHTVKSR
ncbi:YlxR family protein [Mycobacterium tilburgii]|uniref:YlxR family protein n=1 Tax=Mycobacterium tilburgii TaxID=44467 RepID=UPI0028C41AA0|nr:YlxR family protein [Mycobacterium tilburgii]